MNELIPVERIENKIFMIRGQKVMIDKDLAELYNVETKQLNRQVKRNIKRFPAEFMFQLTEEEKIELVTNWHRFNSLKHSSSKPYAFTEHGVAMLASVLKSERAIRISIMIVKTFIKLKQYIKSHRELAGKISEIESKYNKHDTQIQAIFKALRKMIEEPVKPSKKIGFLAE